MMHKVHRKAMMDALSMPMKDEHKGKGDMEMKGSKGRSTFKGKVSAIKRKRGMSDTRARKIVGAMVKKRGH